MDLTEVVRRAQSGDQEAMGKLYQLTSQRVYALALRLTGNPELAMDAVQDSYLSAMQNLDKLREPKAIFQWLFQIVANRCRKLQKKEGRYLSPQQDEEDDRDFFDMIPDPDEKLLPETAADDGETRRLLMDMVNSLPQEQRECIVLFYFAQCPVEQIAQVQSCSEGTVKSRLNYGRKKLKDAILTLEHRDGIRLHTLAPVGLLFRLTMKEVPDPDTLANVWHAVAAQLGTAAAAGGGTAAAAAAGNSATTAGSSAAVKGTVGGAVKLKIAAGIAAGAVAVGGVGVTLHQPAVTFTDPAFEQDIRVMLDKPEGAIRSADLEDIHKLYITEDGIFDSWETSQASNQATGEITPVNSLGDITLLGDLTHLQYAVPDGGALLNTVGESSTLVHFSYDPHDNAPYLEDLIFLEKFTDLKDLDLYVASDTDLTPIETKRSLASLRIYSDGSTTLDVSQLTGLYKLQATVLQSEHGILQLKSSAELPEMRILELDMETLDPSVFELLSQTPDLEFLWLQSYMDTDLKPLSQLSRLRAVILNGDAPLDLTPLTACSNLEVCSIAPWSSVTIPDGLPVVTESSTAFDIMTEVEKQYVEERYLS